MKQRLGRVLLRLVGPAVLAVLLSRIGTGELVSSIMNVTPWVLLCAAFLDIGQIAAKALRWRFLLSAQGISYSVRDALASYFSGALVGLLTPGRLGEFVRILHLTRDCRVSHARAFAGVLVDRLFDLHFLFLFGVLGVLFLRPVGAAWKGLSLLAAAALVLAPALLASGAFDGGRLGTARFLPPLFQKAPLVARNLLREVRGAVSGLPGRAWLSAYCMTTLAYGMFFLQAHVIATSIGIRAGIWDLSYVLVLGALVMLLPISISGLGTREAVFVAYLGSLSVPPASSLALSFLLLGVYYLAGGTAGVAAWWAKPVGIRPLGAILSRLKGNAGA